MESPKVRMSGALEFPFGAILKDTESTPKKLNLKAIFRIEAPVLKSRPSIDLVVVLDITSSNGLPEMQPSKLDLLKKAIGFMISNLDNGDRIAVVAFRNPKDKWSPDGLIEISTEGRKLAKQRVNKLVTVGFAKAKSSLARAVEVLDGRSSNNEEQTTRQGFIILVSDQQEMSDSKDKWTPGDPALGKYPVHTLGLGELHDPTELLLIANESRGTYSSVTKNSEIMETLAVFLALFKSVVAVGASVQITRKQQEEMTRMKILRCWGFSRATSSNNSNKVQCDVLYAGEVKHLVVDMECTFRPTWQGIKYFDDLFTATATYKLAAQSQSEQSNSCSTPMEEQCRLGVTVCTVPSARNFNRKKCSYPSPMFLHQMVRINVLEKCIAIYLQEYQKSNAENANNHALQVQGLGDELERRWKEFKESDESWQEAQRIGLDLQLQRIDSDIDAMVRGLKQQDLGLGSVYSWLSSHMMQRATTTTALALTANASSFLTPAIGEMVNKAQQEQSKKQGAGSSTDNPSPRPPAEEGKEATPQVPTGDGDNPPPQAPPLPPATIHRGSRPGVDSAAAPADNDNTSHPPAGSDDCKQLAVQLLDGIRERFEGWRKMDRGVPPVFLQPSSAEESTILTDLTTVLHKDIIRRAMRYDLYLAAVDAVNRWCNSSGCGQRVNLEQSGNNAVSVERSSNDHCYFT